MDPENVWAGRKLVSETVWSDPEPMYSGLTLKSMFPNSAVFGEVACKTPLIYSFAVARPES